jgi:hypothetical protein
MKGALLATDGQLEPSCARFRVGPLPSGRPAVPGG